MPQVKTSPRIRVLVVDDHDIVREGIRALLARRKDIQVVGEATNGSNALAQVAALHPDIVLMDIAMPEMDGLEATHRISQSFPGTRVLVLTQHDSIEYVVPVLRAGAGGYLLKQTRAEELVRAIRTVYAQEIYLPVRVLHTLVDRVAQSSAPEQDDQTLLTDRERQVLLLVADGLSAPEIASRLCISRKTVITHRKNIMGKLGIHRSAELIKYAIRKGILQL